MLNVKPRFTEHSLTISASPDAVYDIISDVTKWPHFFTPNIHVELLERHGTKERLRMWAMANEEVRCWMSSRTLDADARRITFHQEGPPKPPLLSMGGEWIVDPSADGQILLRLTHEFTVVDDDPGGVDWVRQATERNSQAELASIKRIAELGDKRDELVFSFSDTVPITGLAEDVYEFLHQAQCWPERLPHVSRLVVEEPVPDQQVMEMDTKAPDGSVHTTKSIRVCFPSTKIVYKQVTLPKLLAAHTGHWLLEETPGGSTVSSYHTVTLRESAIEEVLGSGAGIGDARHYVQKALSGNSRITLDHANAFAAARQGA
ncbi:MAG: aromatase [Actinomycetota bacterium]|jgi:aromatase|nr:aromatase [Actinomycetota bacterium]